MLWLSVHGCQDVSKQHSQQKSVVWWNVCILFVRHTHYFDIVSPNETVDPHACL